MAALKLDLGRLKNIKLTKEQQQYLVLGVVGLAAGAYGYWNFLLKPVNESIAKKKVEVKEKSATLEEARKLKVQEEQYRQRVELKQNAEQFVLRRIPRVKDRMHSINRISKICLEENIHLVSYRAEPDTGVAARSDIGDQYDKVVSSIELLTNYHGFGSFLARLSGEDIVYNVDDVQFTMGDQAVKRGLLMASMKIISYAEKVSR